VRTSVWAKTTKALRFAALCVAILFGLASILATGGGGGGGGGSSSSAGSGTVAVLVGDALTPDYEHVYVYVTKVSLIPSPGTAPGPVVIFESSDPAGHKIDLLAYRDEDFLLGVRHNVPAGRYEKIRLEVASVEAVGGPCELELIKLPSGKIDLNPRGGFEVRSGESLAIRLDMDAKKSINLHEAGSSGKCLFRPVVFVDIKPGTILQRCPVNLAGTITDLIDQDKDRTIDGFVLDLTGARGPVTVLLEPDAPVFDANGLPATPAALAKGQQAWTRGRLDAQGRFRARAVVIGQVLAVDGVAQGPVVRPANTFPFLPDVGEALVGQTDAKLYPDKSLVFRGCDAAVGWDAIAQDVPARVFGKFSTVEPELRAAVVLLRNIEISGEVVAFSDSTSPEGRYLTVRTSSGDKIVFVPKGTSIFLEGDGQVPLDLVCTGTTVRLLLDPDAIQPTATEVKVVANLLEGTVTGMPGGNTLLVLPAGQTVATVVHVRDGATIIDQRDDNYTLLNFADIKVTDQLKVFGLNASPCNMLFEAFVVLVVGP
jgi:hypothetical protein